MSEILVRNVDETVVEQLESRAQKNGRTLQAELKLILEQAARQASARISRAEYRALADEIRASIGVRPQADSAALLAEDRAR
jgi:plasmid stability protein